MQPVIPSPSLRSCLGRFATGVAVVTFATEEGPRGVTINSFTSVSIEPPLVLASIARKARAHRTLSGASFCVNVLAAEQEMVARRFAGGAQDHVVRWQDGHAVPRLAGALAHLECLPWREYDGGDHTLFIGRVVDFAYRHGDALAFHASGFTALAQTDVGIEGLM